MNRKRPILFLSILLLGLISSCQSGSLKIQLNEKVAFDLDEETTRIMNLKNFTIGQIIGVTFFPLNSSEFESGESILYLGKKENKKELCKIERAYKTCFIDPKEFAEKSVIYLSLKSVKKCKFQIYASQDGPKTQIPIASPQPFDLYFEKSEVQIFRFQAPSKFHRIVLDIVFKDTDSQANSTQFTFLQNFNLKQKNIGDRSIIQLTLNNETSLSNCYNCEYVFSIVEKIGSYCDISLFIYDEKEQIIQHDLDYIDIVNKNFKNQYTLSLAQIPSWDYLVLHSKFIDWQITGVIEIYANFDTLPENLSNYSLQFQYQNSYADDSLEMELDMERNKEFNLLIDKRNFGQQTDFKVLYVTLVIQVETPYRFSVIPYSFSNREIDIEVNEIIGSRLGHYGVQAFKVKNPKQIKDMKVNLVLESKKGDANLYARKSLTKADYNAKYQEMESNFLARSVEKKDKEQIQFVPEPCVDDSCEYIVYVVCASDEECFYQLQLSYGSDDKVRLPENEAFDLDILWDEQQFFVFPVVDESTIQSLKIMVSSPHVQVYVSTSSECMEPNAACEGILRGSDTRPVSIKKKGNSYPDKLYIAVLGFRHTTYSITAKVVRKNKNGTINFVTLADSKQFSGQLNESSPVNYFKFNANLSDDEDIEINLWAGKNVIEIMVNNDDTLPDDEGAGFQYISSSNFLQISHKSKDYRQKAVYIIAVRLNTNSMKQLHESYENVHSQDITYKIMVSSSFSIKPIELGEPFFDTLLPKDDKFYLININPRLQYVMISRTLLCSDEQAKSVVFYIGDSNYDDPNKFQFKLVGGQKGTFEVNKENLERLCKDNLDTCKIFLAIENSGTFKLQYTLTVWEEDNVIQLRDGIQSTYTLYHVNEFMNFYFHPAHNEVTYNLYLYSFYGRTNFSTLIYKNENAHQAPTDYPYPAKRTPSQATGKSSKTSYKSGHQNSHSIQFSKDSFEFCWPNCVILISVSFIEEETYDKTKANLFDDEFTLLVSSLYNELYESDRVEFALNEHESKYFFYDLKNFLKQSSSKNDNGSSLILSLVYLSGKASLSVSLKDDLRDRYPINNLQYDYLSYSGYLEITGKSLQQLMKSLNMSRTADLNPQLVIEVSAYGSSGRYVLTLENSEDYLVDILHGIPVEFTIPANKVVYFRYFNYFQSDLTIRVTRETGFGYLAYAVCDSTVFEECLESLTEDDYESFYLSGSHGNMIEISQKSEDFCLYCLYIIRMSGIETKGGAKSDGEAQSSIKGYLNVLLDDDAIFLQEGRTLLDNNDNREVNLYRMSVPSSEDADLNIMVYSGKVEVYINYRYVENWKTGWSQFRDGPFKRSSNQSFLHIEIPARDSLDLDDNTLPEYEKTVQYLVESEKLTLDQTFVENEIYVLVRNPSKSTGSNYSIQFTAGENELFMYDGQIIHQELEKSETIVLSYAYYDSEAPAIFTITLDKVGANQIEDLEVEVRLEAKQSHEKLSGQSALVTLQQVVRKQNTLTFGLPSEKGTYTVKLRNKAKKTLGFTVVVNARDMTLVPLNIPVQHLLVENSVNYYEFFSPTKGYFLIHLLHCTGDLIFGYSQEYDKIINHQFDYQATSKPGNLYIDPIKVKKGPLYIALISGSSESYYQLRAQYFSDLDDIKITKIQAGNSGQLEWSRDKENNINLRFTPIECLNCSSSEKSKATVVYHVIVSEDEELLNVMGKCEASNYFDHNAKDLEQVIHRQQLNPLHFNQQSVKENTFQMVMTNLSHLNYSLKVNDHQKVYYASIKAVVKGFLNEKEEIQVFYDTIYIPPNNAVYSNGPWEFFIMVLAAVILVTLLCLLVSLIGRRIYKRSLKDAMGGKVEKHTTETEFNQFDKSSDSFSSQTLEDSQFGQSNSSKAGIFKKKQGYASLEEEM